MEPRENEDLRKALRDAAGGSAGSRGRRIYTALVKSKLHLQTSGPPEADGRVGFVAIRSPDGRTGLAAFTDIQSARVWKSEKGTHWAQVNATWLFEMALGAGFDVIVLNPPGPGMWEVERDEFEALSQGQVPDSEPRQDQLIRVEIAAPKQPIPAETLSYLKGTLSQRPEISAAYFVTIALGSRKPALCLALRLELPSESWTDFIQGLSELSDVPGLPDGFNVSPLSDEMLPGAEKFGLVVLRRA
ncbi:MAG: SseB family protein [Elusimicrobia bacterium]|nr:SseB family protein [Elusimicrobiota bacterium]